LVSVQPSGFWDRDFWLCRLNGQRSYASGQAELLKLADLSYWGDRYPRQDKDGNKIMGINWARAAAGEFLR
jgi:hypothetical protein